MCVDVCMSILLWVIRYAPSKMFSTHLSSNKKTDSEKQTVENNGSVLPWSEIRSISGTLKPLIVCILATNGQIESSGKNFK